MLYLAYRNYAFLWTVMYGPQHPILVGATRNASSSVKTRSRFILYKKEKTRGCGSWAAENVTIHVTIWIDVLFYHIDVPPLSVVLAGATRSSSQCILSRAVPDLESGDLYNTKKKEKKTTSGQEARSPA